MDEFSQRAQNRRSHWRGSNHFRTRCTLADLHSWVEEFWVEMKGSCVQEMGEKRCFWIFNWWEQVDENEGSSDGERTFPFPSSFHPFFPYGGKIVQQIHQTYLPFVKERRKQKRELREAAAADLEVGSWVMAMGTVKFPMFIASTVFGDFLSGYHVGGRELFQSMDSLEWLSQVAWRGKQNTSCNFSRMPTMTWRGVPSWGKFQLPFVR